MSNKKLFIDLTKSISPSLNKFQSPSNNAVFTSNPTSNTSNNAGFLLNNVSFTTNGFAYCDVENDEFKSSPKNGAPKRVPSSPRSCCSSSSAFSSSNLCTTNTTTTTTTHSCSSNCSSKNNAPTSTSSKCLSTSNSSSSTISFRCDSSNCSSNTCNSRLSTPASFSTSASNSSSDSLDEETSRHQASSSMNSSENSINTNSTSTAKITRSTVRKTSNNINENYVKEESADNNNNNNNNHHQPNSAGLKCMWYKCNFVSAACDDSHSLVEHIKSKHIFSQKNQRKFRCVWKGCAVYKNPSCSFNWLERHVVDHIETKPFVCIFTGCKRKFRTEAARERHVQSHMNASSHHSCGGEKQLESGLPAPNQSPSPIKTRNRLLLKSAKMALIQNIKNKSKLNNGAKQSVETSGKEKSDENLTNHEAKLPNYAQLFKALTKRRRPQQADAKKFKKVQYKDYLDDFSLKVIENKLKRLNYNSGTLTFHAEIIAHHFNSSTNTDNYLVEWSPKHIIENEWVEKSKLSERKQVSLAELFKSKTAVFKSPFYSRHRFRTERRK